MWTITGLILLALVLVRQEVRMDQMEQKLDHIDSVIQTGERMRYTSADLDCLTRNIYYEAGVEDAVGKYAVAQVTINRLKAGRWGQTICQVVYAPKQFSWTLIKQLSKPDGELWSQSEQIARQVLDGHRIPRLARSLYYHAVYIRNPVWADPAAQAGQIGNHVFYDRAKGSNLAI
jgi:spore germination cell wall hydrolase CwlJ-like protein